MKNTIITPVLILMLVFPIFTLAQDKKANNIDNSNIALGGYSPVSYLDLCLAQKGIKSFKAEYKKIQYYFTNKDQKAAFLQNPEKYLPQYGGFCAFGVYAGAKFRPDPNKFIVKEGKYYLFLYNLELDAEQLWLQKKDHIGLVKKANENWKTLKSTYN